MKQDFSYAILPGATQTTLHRVLTCIEFSAVPCYLEGIKTTLGRIFSYAMLPGAFQALLYMVLTCAMLSQEYQGKIVQNFFLCNII